LGVWWFFFFFGCFLVVFFVYDRKRNPAIWFFGVEEIRTEPGVGVVCPTFEPIKKRWGFGVGGLGGFWGVFVCPTPKSLCGGFGGGVCQNARGGSRGLKKTNKTRWNQTTQHPPNLGVPTQKKARVKSPLVTDHGGKAPAGHENNKTET